MTTNRERLEDLVALLSQLPRISADDQRRLRTGAAAARLPEPTTDEEVEQTIENLHDGVAALQSLDDLGSPDLNDEAMGLADALLHRARQLGMKEIIAMKRTKIGATNWPMKLADAVEAASAGDVIEVASWAAAQLGHRAAQTMHGADHGILFEVDGKPVAYSDADEPAESDGLNPRPPSPG